MRMKVSDIKPGDHIRVYAHTGQVVYDKIVPDPISFPFDFEDYRIERVRSVSEIFPNRIN